MPSLLALLLLARADPGAGTPAAGAADTALPATVVTAPLGERDRLEVAAAIDAIAVDNASRPGLGIHASEWLAAVPGVSARSRQNHAQDEQLAIRGFGARASFGVRGVRVIVDGIPATMPDGAGQLSHVKLDAADRVEVLRGPYSALHGNAAGGVVQFFSAPGRADPGWRVFGAAGSFGIDRVGISARSGTDAFDYHVALGRFRSEGYRRHSRARRDSGNARLAWDLGHGRALSLVANHLDLPEAQDPLGLTRAQFQDDPRQAAAAAVQFDTRKSVAQSQLGLLYEQPVGERQHLRLMAYGGERAVTQFLAIPVAAQAAPRQSGGHIDLRGRYHGADLRWRYDGELAGQPFDLALGVDSGRNDQHRRGYENFVGDQLGVRGRLRRDEDNLARNVDVYAQAHWRLAERWTLALGVRRSTVRFRVDDRYIVGANPDDSGRVQHRATTPVLGLTFRPTTQSSLYAALGRGFETPTFAELGYRGDGGAGLNLELQPARSRHGEIGYKWQGDGGASAQLALFRADTDDEIALATSSGGRATFRNIGSARRQGVEAGLRLPLGERARLALAYTGLDARFTQAFLACSGNCTMPSTPVAAGARIPGVPRHALFAELSWGDERVGWQASAGLAGVSSLVANDLGTASAPGHVLAWASAGHGWRSTRGDLRLFLRVDNLADRRHVGSVIVNEGNGRFYEPGPGRSVLLGLQWRSRPDNR